MQELSIIVHSCFFSIFSFLITYIYLFSFYNSLFFSIFSFLITQVLLIEPKNRVTLIISHNIEPHCLLFFRETSLQIQKMMGVNKKKGRKILLRSPHLYENRPFIARLYFIIIVQFLICTKKLIWIKYLIIWWITGKI